MVGAAVVLGMVILAVQALVRKETMVRHIMLDQAEVAVVAVWAGLVHFKMVVLVKHTYLVVIHTLFRVVAVVEATGLVETAEQAVEVRAGLTLIMVRTAQ